ncbi:MFS transporter [Actinocatenispora thailandica]|uniref:MFS transporter n=1 Tax=Actinocatenispora thailandica TaxID=227318 RepID=A0A7R7DVM6_9ACTN|nr:MFS transporter [Actinocatenispora thailandica]BCJ38516.1 MFS transporter [Actinocatenispora thailandica]
MGLTTGRRLLFATTCAAAVATVYAAQPVLAEIGADLRLPDAELGWIVTTGQLGYLAGLALLVPLGDMVDRRRLIVIHLVLAAAGVAVAAVATRTWLLLAGVGVAGLFAVVVQTTVAYAAALSTPADRGRTLGTVTAGVVVGILGARVVAGALASVAGWRSSYLALAALLLTLAYLVRRLLPADPRTERATYREVLASLGGLFRERLFVSRGLVALFLFASFGTLWSGLALPLAAPPWRLGTAQIGLFGIAGLAGALGAARAGRWADRGLTGPVTGGALALLTGAWLALGQASWSLWLVGAGVLALDFAVQVVHVGNQHALTAAHPDRTSTVVGGYMIFYSLGSALGAATTTTAYASAGWRGSSILGAAFAGCAVLAWWAGGVRSASSRKSGCPAAVRSGPRSPTAS